MSHVEALMTALPNTGTTVTVTDGHPATLSWLGAVVVHRTIPRGVEHFGQTGTIDELYRHFHIDHHSLAQSVNELTTGDLITLSGAEHDFTNLMSTIRGLMQP